MTQMLGSKPSAPAATPAPPPPAPIPPTVTDATGQAQDQSDALRRRRGAASTVLSTPDTTGAPVTGTKVLLGS